MSINIDEMPKIGFGLMRLPEKGGSIDIEQVSKMADIYMAAGFNYFDTAYVYHSGNSEKAVKKAIVERYPRDSFTIATKLPAWFLHSFEDRDKVFEEQLERCGVDYFDFYLLHNVCEMNIEQYLDPQYGIMDYLLEQKKAGRIKYLGFSCHGELPVLKRFLEAHGSDMEYCQLQLNYLDWEFQHGKEKVELLTEYGIPVWVMEPLRGGKLAKLSEEQEKTLKALRPQEEIPAWAFRFLQSLPEVKVILSGMSNEEQLHANIATFEADLPLNEDEMSALMQVAAQMADEKSVPCTACHYCTDHCPQGLDIPRLIELYNEHILTTKAGLFGFIAPMALAAIPQDKQPAACLHCGSCEQVCPQQIHISDVMEDFVKVLGE